MPFIFVRPMRSVACFVLARRSLDRHVPVMNVSQYIYIYMRTYIAEKNDKVEARVDYIATLF